jgi:hypothetical protein
MGRKRKRYRYISNGGAKPSDPISNFRLIGGNQLKSLDCRFNDVIRIEIPNDMVLDKYSCDNYSTTDDTRTLEELKYNVMVRFKNGFVRRPDFEERKPDELILSDISDRLLKEGYYLTNEAYLDEYEYKACLDKIADEAEKRDEKAEELKAQLDNKQCSVHELKNEEPDVLLKIIELYVREKRKDNKIKENEKITKTLIELAESVEAADEIIAGYLGENSTIEERFEWLKKTYDASVFTTKNKSVKDDYDFLLRVIVNHLHL